MEDQLDPPRGPARSPRPIRVTLHGRAQWEITQTILKEKDRSAVVAPARKDSDLFLRSRSSTIS